MRRAISGMCALAILASVLAVASPAGAQGPAPDWATCSQQVVPVTLSPTDSTVYNIVGQLCLTDDALRGERTVEVTVSGLTYDSSFFNMPYYPETYSYIYAATLYGYSTFNFDRLGVGLSDKPPADKLTVQAHAYTVQQIVRRLRAGAIGGRTFSTVVGVGHSLGAGILQYLAGTVTNALDAPDLLVFSGWLHLGYMPVIITLGEALYPVEQDQAFAGAGLPAGYLTTRPGTRGPVFYYRAGADPAMLAIDEGLKQTGTVAERQTLAEERASTVTRSIKVPVLLSVGQYDTLQCNEAAGLSCASSTAVLTREAASYGPRACLRAIVVPYTGHSVNLHRSGPESYVQIHLWIERYAVTGVGQRDANGCLPAT